MSGSSKRENFYRRDPSKALSGMIGLSLEERGVYNTVIDLLYSTWRPLEDDRAFIANWCGCAVQKLNPIIRRLVERGRLITFTEGGRTYLSDDHFEAERTAVKGSKETRSGRGQIGEKSGEVGEKSAGVEEKSAGVGQNHPVLDSNTEEKQPVTALEKSRQDKSREKTRKARTALPANWTPTEAGIEFAAQRGFTGPDVQRELLKFAAHHLAAGKTMADWSQAWRTWIMHAEEWRRQREPKPVKRVSGALV